MTTVQRLEALSTSLSIASRTAYFPDAAEGRLTSVNFYALLEQGGIGLLAGGDAAIVGLTQSRLEAFIDAALRAVGEGSGSVGVDTAIGRPITTLSITVEQHGRDRAPRCEQYQLNHLDVRPKGHAAWGRLLHELRDCVADAASRETLEHIVTLTQWFAPE